MDSMLRLLGEVPAMPIFEDDFFLEGLALSFFKDISSEALAMSTVDCDGEVLVISTGEDGFMVEVLANLVL
jgi:hypothetical protein